MWRQQLFKDICCLSPFLSLVQRLTLSGDVISKKVRDDITLLLTSDTCCRDDFYLRTLVGLISYYLYSSLYFFLIYSRIGTSSDGLMSSDRAIGLVSMVFTVPPD